MCHLVHSESKNEDAHSLDFGNRQVYMAKNKQTDEVVAIKKIRSLNEVQGVRSTVLRNASALCLARKDRKTPFTNTVGVMSCRVVSCFSFP